MENKKKEKGGKGEAKFKEWLEKNNIPYMYFDQKTDTYSPIFKGFAKRPDFMLLIPNFGFILVDVKTKEFDKKYKTLCLDLDESIKYSNLQRHFNLQVWYAVSNESVNFDTWYWMSVTNLMEMGTERYMSKKDHKSFFPLQTDQYIQMKSSDSISQLFEKMWSWGIKK